MPASKSPNNAFNLHKEHMKSVFDDICRGLFVSRSISKSQLASRPVVSPYLMTSLNLHHLFSTNDQQSSKPFFYWETRHYENQRELYSKGYIMTSGGGIWSGRCEGCFNTTTASIVIDGEDKGGRCEREAGRRLLVTKVREYYTDGVRAIGAME